MAQRGQHVLIVDDGVARQRILEVIMERTGRWVTIAQNGDEAMAILKSTLHPLVVLVDARMRYLVDGKQVSLLLTLLANPEYTRTHAFIVTAPPTVETERLEIVETAQRLGDEAHVGWLELPGRFTKIAALTDAAERFVKSRA